MRFSQKQHTVMCLWHFQNAWLLLKYHEDQMELHPFNVQIIHICAQNIHFVLKFIAMISEYLHTMRGAHWMVICFVSYARFFSKVLWTKNDTLFLESISHTVVNVKPLIYFSKHCKRIKKTNTASWNMGNIQIPSARRLKTIFFRNMDVVICMSNTYFGFFYYFFTQWFVSWKWDKYPRMGKTLNLFLYTNIASYFLCINGHFIFFGSKTRCPDTVEMPEILRSLKKIPSGTDHFENL